MTSTPKVLIAAADLPNASTLLYTSPAGGKGTWIDKATSVNHTAGAVTVTVYLVPAAGAAGNTNVVTNAQSIAAAGLYSYAELVGKFLNPGDMVYALCSAAASANFAMNGRELT